MQKFGQLMQSLPTRRTDNLDFMGDLLREYLNVEVSEHLEFLHVLV